MPRATRAWAWACWSGLTPSIVPKHAELTELGWSAPRARVTRHAGVVAGEEIAEWLLERLVE